MKYFVILIFFQFVRLICGHRFDASANVSDVNGEKNVIQKRFGLLKYLFGFGSSDDNTGATVIIDRRFRTPKRRRRLRKCFVRGRRYRRPVYASFIGRRNFDLTPRYIGTLPAFKQPPEDKFYYTFPNGLFDGDRNVDMYEPAPGDLLYPPMAPKISQNTKLYLHSKTGSPELHPFYEHEAINLLPAPTTSNDLNNLYLRNDAANTKPFLNYNVVVPRMYKNTIVTPSPVDRNILTLSKLINDRRKKTIHQQQYPQQNSQGNTVIPLKRTSNPSTTILKEPHQSNYPYYPATKLFKNSLNSSNHDLFVTSNNKNVKLMITSDDRYQYGDGDYNTKTTRDDHDHNHYYDTCNLQNTHTQNNKMMQLNDGDRTRLLYTIDDKRGVLPMNMMDQVNDEGNYLKIHNIEPNYNWVNVDTKTVLGDKTPTPNKYSSSIPATENPLKANSIIGERTEIY